MRACHCIVEGRVQGVGFRYFTQRIAERFGICGWVRNLSDGNVEIRAEGESAALENFLNRIRNGPSFSQVTSLRESPAEVAGFRDFGIRM